LPTGKLTVAEIESICSEYKLDDSPEHVVKPGMVYISNPTEYGTIYSKEELIGISNTAKKYNIPLYLDGARMGFF
jgi:threonine aldolase